MLRKLTIKPLAIAALLIATPVMAMDIMPGDKGRWHGYMPEGYIGSYSHVQRLQRSSIAPQQVQQNGGVPRFCYSLRTGKFTHWGPCRVVVLPTGQRVKVAN
jgi:hypothetical protein